MTGTEEKKEKVMESTTAPKDFQAMQQQAAPTPDGGYEKEDVNGGRLIGSFIIGVLVIGFIMFLVSEYFNIMKERQIFESAVKPENNLLRDVRQREDGVLNTYKVVDEAKGVYQIPIAEAMKRIADETYQKKATAAKPSEIKPVETEPAGGKPVDPKPVDPKQIDAKLSGAKVAKKSAAKKTVVKGTN
jgi:hypothetical protein